MDKKLELKFGLMRNYDEMSEKELVIRMQAGDVKILHWLLNGRYKAGLRYLVYRYYGTYEEAEDFISDLTELLIKDDCRVLKSFNHRASFRTWLFTVARHLICKNMKKRSMRSELKIDDGAVAGYNIDTVMDLGMILARLSPKHRLVLKALFIYGWSPDELAKHLGCRVDNVYNLKRRALVSARLIVEYMSRERDETDGTGKTDSKNNEKKNRKK